MWVGANERKRETKRDKAPEASCYATADLLTYISKQKQRAAGYCSASPTKHKESGQTRTGCAIHAEKSATANHFACFISTAETYTKGPREYNSSPRTPDIVDTLKRYVCVFAWVLLDAHTNQVYKPNNIKCCYLRFLL